jgi:hypothetical protein
MISMAHGLYHSVDDNLVCVLDSLLWDLLAWCLASNLIIILHSIYSSVDLVTTVIRQCPLLEIDDVRNILITESC